MPELFLGDPETNRLVFQMSVGEKPFPVSKRRNGKEGFFCRRGKRDDYCRFFYLTTNGMYTDSIKSDKCPRRPSAGPSLKCFSVFRKPY